MSQDATERVRALVLQDHYDDRPGQGAAWDRWVNKTCKKYELSPKHVCEWVATEATNFKQALRDAYETQAQKQANMLGLTMARVIQRVNEGLDAQDEEVLKGKKGHLFDKAGNPVVHKKYDWKAIAQFAKLASEWHGMAAPDQVEVNIDHRVQITTLSEDEIDRKIIEHAQQRGLQIPAGRRVIDVAGGEGCAESGQRSAVLADELHKNGRRAGKNTGSKPVQAVPEPSLFPADHGPDHG
jgi:hypothetical protein